MKGLKYEQVKNLDIKEIAKLIRKDLSDKHPNFKFSVTISRFSMGRSIDIEIKEINFCFLNPKKDYKNRDDEPIYSEKGLELLESVQNIVKQYNYDNSNSMIDYYDVNFYSNVRYSYELREKNEKEIKELV